MHKMIITKLHNNYKYSYIRKITFSWLLRYTLVIFSYWFIYRTHLPPHFATRLFNEIEYLKLKLIYININYKYGKCNYLLKIFYFIKQSRSEI